VNIKGFAEAWQRMWKRRRSNLDTRFLFSLRGMSGEHLLFVIGIWLMIDGLFSSVKYINQSKKEHAIRVVRILAGMIVLYFGVI
jgi:uncharacterized membrane protein HdeD (DUF308 family)